MAHSALRIANAIIEKCGGPSLGPMKLLKLAYLAQGWMLGLYQRPMIVDDVEAWKYGPVYRQVYRQVAGGRTSIDSPLTAFDNRDLDKQEEDLLNQVCKVYGHMTGLQLSAITHADGSPWDQTYRNHGQNAVIPKTLMQEYYAGRAAAAKS